MVECLKCGDIVESTHQRDYRTCSCKSVSLDGGVSRPRILGFPENYRDLSVYKDPPRRRTFLEHLMEEE